MLRIYENSAELTKYERKTAVSDSVCEICNILSPKAWPIHSFTLMCTDNMYQHWQELSTRFEGENCTVSNLFPRWLKTIKNYTEIEIWIQLKIPGTKNFISVYAVRYYFIPEEVKWSEVTQSCPTICDPMDCSPPGSSVHGIFQAREPSKCLNCEDESIIYLPIQSHNGSWNLGFWLWTDSFHYENVVDNFFYLNYMWHIWNNTSALQNTILLFYLLIYINYIKVSLNKINWNVIEQIIQRVENTYSLKIIVKNFI